MSIAELEELIRRYLSTGIAVVLVLVAPGTGSTGDAGLPSGAGVVTVQPEAGAAPSAGDPATGDPAPEDRTGAAGTDPGLDDDPPAAERATPTRTPTAAPSARPTDETPAEPSPSRTAAPGSASGGPPGGADPAPEPDVATDPEPPRDTAPTGRSTPVMPEAGPGATGVPADTTGTTAAERFGWGTPGREEDFSDGTDGWQIYEGPGHAGKGMRSESAISIENGVLTITGDAEGTTAGMAWLPGQMYGRWEGRVRAPAADPSYHALLLLWPDAEDFPVGGEIDFMEMSDPTRQETDFFVHYGEDNSQVGGTVQVDATEWHNWAVEWSPDGITAYLDGEEWYRTTDTSVLPPGPMHLSVQLDWFGEGDAAQESSMQVDWVRQYPLDGDGTPDNDPGNDPEGATDDPVREAVRRMFAWR